MVPMRADNTEHLQKAATARRGRTRRRAIEMLDIRPHIRRVGVSLAC